MKELLSGFLKHWWEYYNGREPIIIFPPKNEECLEVIKLHIRYIIDHFDSILTTVELVGKYINKFLNEFEKRSLSVKALIPSPTRMGTFVTRIIRYNPIDMTFMRPGDSLTAYIDIIHDSAITGVNRTTAQATWNISIYNGVSNWINKVRSKFSDVSFKNDYISFSAQSSKLLLSEALGYETDVFRVTLGQKFIMEALDDNYCGVVRTEVY